MPVRNLVTYALASDAPKCGNCGARAQITIELDGNARTRCFECFAFYMVGYTDSHATVYTDA